MVRRFLVPAVSLILILSAGNVYAEKNTGKPRSPVRPAGGSAGDAECTDADGDGYGTGADCLGPDCDDTNEDVHPDADELCNGFDDNCTGGTDEGFTVFAPDGTAHCSGGVNQGMLCKVAGDCAGGACVGDEGVFLVFGDLPLGRQCVSGLGVCTRIGSVVCNEAGTAAVCDAVAGPPDPAGEGVNGPTDETCFDRVDNDCDGIVDHGGLNEENERVDNPNCKTEELCDGFDNDNDGTVDNGFELGAPCTVGNGPCQNAGVIVCKEDGTAGCNVSPLPPGVENIPGSTRCSDGKDNDCDGLADLADSGCQAPEKCDGKDNDGNGQIDETFDLGEICSTGVGACKAFGVRVCSADQTQTVCTAVALTPVPEIPTGNICADGVDNDCDGLIDLADVNCNPQALSVQCALLADEAAEGDEGHDCRNADHDNRRPPCSRTHRVFFETSGADASDIVTAELLAIDSVGAVARTLTVENGDTIQLANRLDGDVAMETQAASDDKVFARFDGLTLGSTFTLVPEEGKQKLPNTLYLHALRLPEGLKVETSKLPLNCNTPLWSGTLFGSFELVNVESFQQPFGNQTCRGGVKEITLRYVGKETHGSAAVDAVITTDTGMPRASHEVTTALPVLRVTVKSPTSTAQAYCSTIPFVQVVQPNGSVSTGEGNVPIPVLAAIPNIDPSTLSVKVGGVDVLDALGIDPTRDLPGGPFAGEIEVGGTTVEVENLILRSAPSDIPNANTLTMDLNGLGCGAHNVEVTGDAAPKCDGRVSGLRLRYEGGGCPASAHTQCDRKYECYGHAKAADPVRVKVTDKRGRIYLDTGMPASVHLRDTVEVLASAIGRQRLTCDTIVKVFSADNYMQEEFEFCTSCSEPLTVGYIFGSFRVVGLESGSRNSAAGEEDGDDCDGDDGDGMNDEQPAYASAPSKPTGREGSVREGENGAEQAATLAARDNRGRSEPTCYVDDLRDSGAATVFRIDVSQPVEGQVTAGGPTRVVGSVCHGKRITEADVNGFALDIEDQVVTPGDGSGSGDLYTLDFDVLVPVTNLRKGIAEGDTTGSFDPGSNLLVARAMDENFNTTFDTLTFAVGPIVQAPPVGMAVAGQVAGADPPNFVQRAFVMGINTTGISKVFTAQKDSNKRCMGDRVKKKLRDQRPPPKTLSVDDACDPSVSMTINGTDIRDGANGLDLDFGIVVDPNPNKIDVRIDLPPIDMKAHFGGYCQSGCVCAFGGCLCASCVTVSVDMNLVRKNMFLAFSVTEQNILQTGIPRELREPLDFDFNIGESNDEDATHLGGEVDIGCALGFLLDVADFFVFVFTLGFVSLDLDVLDFEIEGDDMKDRFESLDGDPMNLEFVKMKKDDEALNDFDSKQRESKLTGCEITDGGMSISVGSAFEPKEDKIDPEARPIPGTPLKNAPVPQPPISDFLGRSASEVTIGISDDVFNQLFYNMTQTGKLKTEFEHVRELRSFMPEDCDTIPDESRRARCIGWKTQDCAAFPARSCSEESLNAGESCVLDSACRLCNAGSPNAGETCTGDLACGQVCTGALAGTECSTNGQCTGVCSAGSVNEGDACSNANACGKRCVGGTDAGDTCTQNFQCAGGGTCSNSGTCDGVGTCGPIAGACDDDGECLDVDPLRRSCVIGKLLADRFNIGPDTQMILRAKIDEAPKLLIDDDPTCEPGAGLGDACRTGPVEVKLHVSNLTIAMIADRNNNSIVDGDEATLAACNFGELNSDNILELENETAGTVATDCLMFLHCLKVDVNFSMGVETVGDRNRIKMEFGGIDRQNSGGYQCGGAQSLPELDFFNSEAGRDSSLDQLEGNMRDNTPRVAPEGLDLGGNVAFTFDRILAIRTRPLANCVGGTCNGGFNNGGSCNSNADCEDGYQDYIGLTGHTAGTPGPNPPCPN